MPSQTPDSKLTLRCSSTQAQVLLTDSAYVAIVEGDPSGWQQKHKNQPKFAHSSAHLARSGGHLTATRGNNAAPKNLYTTLQVALFALLLYSQLAAEFRFRRL